MEDFSFDVNDILPGEDADKLFEEQGAAVQEENTQPETQEDKPAEKEEEAQPSERVGEEETEENAVENKSDGSSPNVFSSIAGAFKKDGIFPDFDDAEISAVKTADDLAEMVQKAISAGIDERVKRADKALGVGVEPTQVQEFEQTLGYLDSITEDMIKAEGDEGEALRRKLIFNDLLTRGYTEEKAKKEVEKSFKSVSDVEDAADALDALKKHFQGKYDAVQQEAQRKQEEAKAFQKKQTDTLKKMILEDDVKLGETKLDKKTCQRVYDAVMTPVYKDPQSGRLLTAVQKFQQEHPLEFLQQIGMWYVLTDGGKNTEGFTKAQLRAEKNKNIAELGRKINSTSLSRDGSLQYISNNGKEEDPLLSDGWQVGW